MCIILEKEVKELCEQMELEFIRSVKCIDNNETAYIIYNEKYKDEILYSYDELQKLYDEFLDK